MKQYKVINLNEAYDILNEGGGLKWQDRPLSFTFDLRPERQKSVREWSKWYAFQYAAVTDIPIIIGVSYYKEDLEAEIETSRAGTIDFMTRYCKKYYPEFKGKICVDMEDWAESDPFYKEIQRQNNERGLF